jgi:MFS family permease
MRAISTLVLAAATAVGSIGLAAGGTAGALIAAELTGGSASAGVPLGAVVVGSAGGALLISRVTRHAGRITGLAVGYAIGSLGAALVVAATVAASLGLVVAGSVVMGVANAAVYLTRYAAADLVPGAARGRAVGVVLSGAAVGAVAGPNLLGPSGELAAGLGLPRFSGLYLVAAVAFPAAGALLGLPGRRAGRPRADRDRRPAPAPGRIAGTRGAVLVLVVTNLVMVAVMAMAPLHLLAHGHDLDVVGVAVSIHVLCMLAPAPLAGWLADRTGPAPVAGLGAGLLATGGLTGAVVGPDSTVGFTAVLAILGLGWCAGVVAGSAMLVASQPEAERPRAEGIGELAMGLAAGAGATLAGLVVAVGGFPVFAVATAAVSLVILLQVASRPRAAGASAGPAAARSKVSI